AQPFSGAGYRIVHRTPPRKRAVRERGPGDQVPAAGNWRGWGGRWDSNPRRPDPQSGALPTELRPPDLDFSRPRASSGSGAPGRTRTCNPRLSLPPLLSQPPPRGVRGLDYLFTVSGAARIVSTDPRRRATHSNGMRRDSVAGFHGVAIGATR